MVSAKKRIEGMPKSVQEYEGGSSNKDGTEKSSWRHAKQKSKSSAASTEDLEVPRLDIRSILKDIEHLGITFTRYLLLHWSSYCFT